MNRLWMVFAIIFELASSNDVYLLHVSMVLKELAGNFALVKIWRIYLAHINFWNSRNKYSLRSFLVVMVNKNNWSKILVILENQERTN